MSSFSSAWRGSVVLSRSCGLTPHANVARSSRETSRFFRGLGLRCLIACAAILGSQYLAGYLLLWSFHLQPQSATPLTIARYAHFYGDRPPVRRRIILWSALSFALVGGAVGVLLLPKPRPLHGETSFATRREIAD